MLWSKGEPVKKLYSEEEKKYREGRKKSALKEGERTLRKSNLNLRKEANESRIPNVFDG